MCRINIYSWCLIIIQIVRQRAEEAIDAGDHGGDEGDNSDDYNYYNKNDVDNFCPNVSLPYDHSVNYPTSQAKTFFITICYDSEARQFLIISTLHFVSPPPRQPTTTAADHHGQPANH